MILVTDDLPSAPWKNGGGSTRELLRRPSLHRGAADWRVRVSVADITADGPFSPFPGVTRHFAVLSGAGVGLAWPDGRAVEQRTGDGALVFDGAAAPEARLLDGPTRDLNVMVRDGARAALHPAHWRAPWRADGHARALFTRQPAVLRRKDDAPLSLPGFALFWQDDPDAQAWTLVPASNAPADDTAPAGWWIVLDPTSSACP